MQFPSSTQLSGIWLPLITPFIDGAVDDASLARLVTHYVQQRIDGLIVAATTGEGLVLDHGETERVVTATADVAARRKPVFLGLCGSDTRRLARRLAATAAWPVDGYLIACPYYSRPSQEGLYQHFTALADATDRPILIYNIPYRTGVNLGNDTMLRLAEHANIVGVKDCCADAAQSVDLLRRRGPKFAVLTGEDALFHDAIAHGADGGILASAHVDVAAFAAVRAAVLEGRWADALVRWEPLVDVIRLLFAEPYPAPIKHVLWRRGLIATPELRLPMTGISSSLASRLDRLLLAQEAAE
jgi:4-hydroxy-tetrahydrodipicolinate synthase